jgi:pyruvate carboxylase
MKRALNEIKVEGIETNILFHRITMDDPQFNSGKYTTNFVEKQQIVKKVREYSGKTQG